MWIQSRSIQNHRSQINTSVSLNELKFLYLSTKVSLLLNLTGSRKWSSALQTKKQEKTMSILGTWILRTWLYTNYVFSLFHPLQEVDFLNKIIMSSHDMTCTSKYGEKITCALHQKKTYSAPARSYYSPCRLNQFFLCWMHGHIFITNFRTAHFILRWTSMFLLKKVNYFSSSWSNPFHFWITLTYCSIKLQVPSNNANIY